jgi:hypothetical protein
VVASRTPSAIAGRFHRARVLFGQRDQLAVRAGAGRAPGVVQQHQREQPGDLAVLGQHRVHR